VAAAAAVTAGVTAGGNGENGSIIGSGDGDGKLTA